MAAEEVALFPTLQPLLEEELTTVEVVLGEVALSVVAHQLYNREITLINTPVRCVMEIKQLSEKTMCQLTAMTPNDIAAPADVTIGLRQGIHMLPAPNVGVRDISRLIENHLIQHLLCDFL